LVSISARPDSSRSASGAAGTSSSSSPIDRSTITKIENGSRQASLDEALRLGAYLADRPHEPGDLVFTAPMGGPLDRAGFVKTYFKPAIRAANEALAQLPRDQRPRPLPEGLRLDDLRHTCASLLIAKARR
jgi:integrase